MTKEVSQEGKRSWKRRTHQVLSGEIRDLYDPAVIDEIKGHGEEPLTPIEALGAFGTPIKKEHTQLLNSILLQVDNQLFSHTDETTFPSNRIEDFLQVAQDARSQIFGIIDIPQETKDHIVRNASAIIGDLIQEQRERDWAGRNHSS